MTRFWLPLLIFAALACCTIAYLREQARQDAEWDSVCDSIQQQAERPRRGGR